MAERESRILGNKTVESRIERQWSEKSVKITKIQKKTLVRGGEGNGGRGGGRLTGE